VNKRAETHGIAAFAAFTAGEQEWIKCSLCSLPFTMGELLQPTPALTYSAFVQFVQKLGVAGIMCNYPCHKVGRPSVASCLRMFGKT